MEIEHLDENKTKWNTPHQESSAEKGGDVRAIKRMDFE